MMGSKPEGQGKDRRKDTVTENTGDGQDARKKDTVKPRATASRMLRQTAKESNRENGSEAEHQRKQGLKARPKGEPINNRAEEQDSERETQRRGHVRQPQIEREKSTEGHRQKQRDGRKKNKTREKD